MKFHLEVSCSNSAFDPDPLPEITRFLKEVIYMITADHSFSYPLYDINGNRVGFADLISSDEEVSK